MFKDLSKLLKSAKVLKDKMNEVQDELAKKTLTVSTGGGMVTVVMNGSQEIVSMDIEDAIISKEDKQMLKVLIISAVNEAMKQTKDMISKEISSATMGIDPKFFKDFE